jgi:hypothetical protein
MKRRNAIIRPGGALLWSTTAILAGLGLSGCQRNDYVATAKDQQMAETQKRIEELDAQKTKLMGGEVPNNFFIQGVGYYHAAARDFFQHPYGFSHEGKWFVDGRWQATAPVETVAASKPVPEALKKVEAALQKEQQLMAGQSGAGATHSSGGFGMGNALLMYWLLAGNRGGFMPGAGFQRAAAQAPAWQGEVDRQRSAVSGYAASNPGYRRMVEQSKASGTPVRTGQSVRGGFGSSRSSGGGSFSSGG